MPSAATTTERRERFEALVRQAERLGERSPGAYRLRIGALAMLGYLVIFGALALLVALLGGTVWMAFASTALFLLLLKKKLIIVLAIVAWVLLKALWVRFGRPEGIRVSERDAPALFAELRALKDSLDLPRIHEVLITEDFNAAVAQSPRLGVLGWHRNSLILGIRLMLALSPEEMRAVLAHEAGHLSGNHSRFNAWIYRVRTTWYRIMEAFDQAEGLSVALLRRFFDWYAPYFNAMSFTLARTNEYEADAIAVQLTSREHAASALVGSNVRDDIAAQDYWQPLLRRAETEPEPERAPFRGLAQFHARHRADPSDLHERVERALALKTDHSDTHPSLSDRLAAIGAEPVQRFNVERNAAEVWLGDALDGVLDRLDADWVQRNGDGWRQQYEATREALAERDALAARAREDLEPLELWRLAALTEEHGEADDALALYREYQAREPEDRDADFVIGRILLARDDPAGIACMERASEKFVHALDACEHVYAYLMRHGDEAAAERWRLRGEREVDRQQQFRAERNSLDRRDTFVPAEIPEPWLARLREQLESYPEVKEAWLARKQVTIAPEIPIHVIALRKKGWFKSAEKLTQRLADEMETPAECFFVVREGETKRIAKAVEAVGERLI